MFLSPENAEDDPDAYLQYMQLALTEAHQAMEAGEVPVGAVIVRGSQVIAAAHNQRAALADPTAHAEMIAITQAAGAVGDWRLSGCTLFVTLEPCPMCAGAILQARIPQSGLWGARSEGRRRHLAVSTLRRSPAQSHGERDRRRFDRRMWQHSDHLFCSPAQIGQEIKSRSI